MKGQVRNRILIKREKSKLSVRRLKNLLLRLLEAEGFKDTELSLYLTGDKTIRELNKAYRNKDKATDVLSFPIRESVGNTYILGEIVISVDTAKRQAEELGHTFEEEVERLLLHGFVHLLGYDHELGEEEEKRFKEKEESLIKVLRYL